MKNFKIEFFEILSKSKNFNSGTNKKKKKIVF